MRKWQINYEKVDVKLLFVVACSLASSLITCVCRLFTALAIASFKGPLALVAAEGDGSDSWMWVVIRTWES